MKQRLFLLILMVLQGLFIFSCKQADNKLTDLEKEEGWKLLFDGNTLEGWRDYLGESVAGPWEVEKGVLTALGQGSDSTGYLITDDQYENFILTFDWKIAEGGNSGVFYHVVERPYFKVPYITGPEYQVIDDLGFPEKLEEWQKTAADYAMHVSDNSKKHVKKAGRWNSSKIVFDNGHVEHWLNGEKVIEFEAWSDDWFERRSGRKYPDALEYGLARSGHFVLQDHGSSAWYKNIKLKELPRKPKEEVLFNGKDLTGWEIFGTELWYVEDGELVCESGPDKKYGYLGTRKYYNDFELSLDFKQITDGNSGVFIRSYLGTSKRNEMEAWQVEIAPPGKNTGGIWESLGRGWLAEIPEEKETILKEREWNTLRVRASGDNITTWLNGEEMTVLNDAKIGQGHGRILLQIHDGHDVKLRWKNIHLKEL